MMVFLVALKMLSEFLYPIGKDGYLNFSRTCVIGCLAVLSYDLRLDFLCDH